MHRRDLFTFLGALAVWPYGVRAQQRPTTPATSKEGDGRNARLVIASAEAKNSQELESAFVKLTKDGVDAVMFVPDAFFFAQRERIAELALRCRLPSIFVQREYVAAGGLMSYGENDGPAKGCA
jgi:hypothetical protein